MIRPRVLVIAEAANPEWTSVPLVGWSHCKALAEVADIHVVTHVRNREALARAGWNEGAEVTLIDSEKVAAPLYRVGQFLRRVTGLGWTLTTAMAALPYYYFERLVWRHFGAALAKGEFSLVHRLTPLSPTIPSTMAKRCAEVGVPFVLGPLNGGVPWPKGFANVQASEGEWLSYLRDAYKQLPGYRDTRRKASAIIVGSQATWEQMGVYRDKCVYVPENAIDPERFSVTTERAVTKPLRLAFVGRLVPYKGADVLFEAAAPLVRDGRAVIDIIGDGPERARLTQMRDDLHLGAGVKMDGWIDHRLLQRRLIESDVFAFPSVREFGGGVVLEAMALGLVPVVADYAGPAEIVTAQTGFRVALGSRAELINGLRGTLEHIVEHPQMVRPMGARARAHVLSLFTWQAKARQTLQVYRWAMGLGPKPDFGMPFADATPDGDPPTTTDPPSPPRG